MRPEIVSPEGFRLDGRRPAELRRISFQSGTIAQADGSGYVEHGNTKCLARIYGPQEPSRRANQSHDKASVNVEFDVASFSTGERKQRRRQDRRLMELAYHIKTAFEAIIMIGSYPRSEINIHIQILQVDGGLPHAAINAATLALIDAGVPMQDYVVACSSGFANGSAILDTNFLEETADVPIVTVALLPTNGKVVLLEMESRLHLNAFPEVLNLATEGCKQIALQMQNHIRHAAKPKILR
ncbi:Exosome complex component RRP41 [Blyttiomyces sp. JEL0837]|nr:Exosome complex component RRP41 [Blyttiomyces sp. JEL0837]